MRAGLFGLVLAAMVAVVAAAPALAVVRVVATTTDMAALVAAVGGDLVSVETLIPPATDPEAFEPRPGDLDRVRHANLLVRVGLGYDFWLDPLIHRVGDKRLMRGGTAYLDASAGVPLLEIRGQSVVKGPGRLVARGRAAPGDCAVEHRAQGRRSKQYGYAEGR